MANIQIKGLVPGKSYDVQIRAKDGASYSDWSNKFTFTADADTTAPSTPSAAKVLISSASTDYQNTLTARVKINGKTDASQVIETDTSYFEVYASSVNASVSATKIGDVSYVRVDGVNSEATLTVPLSGSAVVVTPNNVLTSLYFFIRAVDRSGNKSPFSIGVLPETTTYFANAYISDLSADKIVTGTLQANQQISVGSITPIVMKANSVAPLGQLYSGTGASGNANTPFYLDTSGNFTLSDTVKFTSGGASIAGWTVTASSLYSGTGTSYVAIANSGLYSIWAGSATASAANFSLTNTGSLFATAGEIGGWKINPDKLSYDATSGPGVDNTSSLAFIPYDTNINVTRNGTNYNYYISQLEIRGDAVNFSSGEQYPAWIINTDAFDWAAGISSYGIQSRINISAGEVTLNSYSPGGIGGSPQNWLYLRNDPSTTGAKGIYLDGYNGINIGSSVTLGTIKLNGIPTKAVQSGASSTTASYTAGGNASIAVTFATTFNSAPNVTVSIRNLAAGTQYLVPRASNISTSSFTIFIYNTSSGNATPSSTEVQWIAAGN